MAPSFDCLLCSEDSDYIGYDNDDDMLSDHGNNQNSTHYQNLETEDSVLDVSLQSDECINLLIEKECEQFVGVLDYFSKLKNGNFDFLARQEAIDWITKVHAHFSFGPLSAYLAINYIDRFLAVYELPAKAWMMQLLAVACLSLASKMEETEVPLILDLQVSGSKFYFEPKTIQKMELLVMATLKWRMQAVTPISFIDYFLLKVNAGQPILRSMILRSNQLFFCLIRGIDFLEFRPSEIAAAVAIHVVGSSQYSTLDHHIQKERVLKCMELLRELNGDYARSLMSGTLTSMPKSPIGVLEAACLSFKTDDATVESCLSSANKRRRPNNTTFDLEI